ncbi:MAG: NPCBM/NEW2 domain-containing protein [Planctomycetaceae bacterium]
MASAGTWIWVAPQSTLHFSLKSPPTEPHTRFYAEVGLAASWEAAGSVEFVVTADQHELYRSGRITGADTRIIGPRLDLPIREQTGTPRRLRRPRRHPRQQRRLVPPHTTLT